MPLPRAGFRLALPLLLAALALGGCGWRNNQPATQAKAQPAVVAGSPSPAKKVALVPRQPPTGLPHFADFGRQHPSHDARHVADWALDSGDNEGKAYVLVDKKDAKVYVFNPRGHLVAAAPALVGAAVGDDPVPGIGDKPLSQVLPEEKTTPAGRYVAEPGVNANGEDVVWVSWDLAVSMHRVRPLVKAERRLQRLASATPKDNRISFGCINLPVAFYEKVLRPTVKRDGAIVYVLPETRTPQEQFGSYEVRDRAQQLAGLARTSVK
ncbi:hypothetical protein ACPWT1_10780 [Ramlibacter sp. MMS24-I3-19]|uniref:hypothetical protein n=1 Tax=Ramlibacter sp. MMS24-I3-19 TaxID=3416606 RepID=UPI003D01488E